MKKSSNLNKFSILAAFLIVGGLCLQSCEKKLAELTEGTLVEINSDLLHTPIIASFKDARDGSIPNNISVEFGGKDAGLLYSTSGKATLKPTAGLMDIGFAKSIEVSEENPFEFTIMTKATGYLPTFHSVVLTDLEARELTIELVKMDNLPDGVTLTNHTFTVGATGTAEEMVLETVASNSDAPFITIPQGTKMLNADGNELTGQVNFQIVNFDPAVAGALAFAPQTNRAKLANGEMANGVFADLTNMDFTMMVGNQEVKSFSTPLMMEAKIPTGATDNDGQPITEGFAVPSWSLDEATGAWQFEAENTIESNGGALVVRTAIPHFSKWTFSIFFQSFISTLPQITINSDIPNDSELNYRYHSELVWSFWNWNIPNYRWSRKTRHFRSGQVILKPYYVHENLTYRLKVYDGPRGCERTLLSETATFKFKDRPTVNLNSLFAIQPIVNLNFVANVLCDGATVKPTLYVMYKESTETCWRLLGVMVNGEINTNQLDLDTSYDFRSIWNDEEHTLDNVVVRDEAIRFGAENGISEGQVNAALADINNVNGTINVNNVTEPLAAWVIAQYQIMPSQAECDALTGN